MSVDRDLVRRVVTRVVDEKLTAGAGNRSHDDDGAGRRRRELLTESDVMAAHREGRDLVLPPDAIVTPLARDAIGRYGVSVREGTGNEVSVDTVRAVAASVAATAAPSPSSGADKGFDCPAGTVAIASDHGGFEMKQFLIRFLEEEAGISCLDLGTNSTDAVDYPDFARAVAESVASDRTCRGIVVDGAGIGSAMTANKVKGVRCAHCSSVAEAQNAREHNDANVLSLGGRMIGYEMAKAIAIVFLKTDFAGGRHQLRVDKIMDTES